MKFITEYDLRARFNEQAFTDYQLEKDERLTPGARQFLSDRGINLFEDGTRMRFGLPPEADRTARLPGRGKGAEEQPPAAAGLAAAIDVLAAEYLVVTGEIIEKDIELAGMVSDAGHALDRLKLCLTDGPAAQEASFMACSGMRQEDCCQDMGDCFSLSDFHIQSPKGRTLVLLNALRAKTRALGVSAARELADPGYAPYLTAVTGGIACIVNKLSQMICKAAGVKECKRNQ